MFSYSRSSHCDHSRKWPALVTTTNVKLRFKFHLNSLKVNALVSDRSRKRPRPPLGLPSWTFSLFLRSRKRPLRDSSMNVNTLIKTQPTALRIWKNVAVLHRPLFCTGLCLQIITKSSVHSFALTSMCLSDLPLLYEWYGGRFLEYVCQQWLVFNYDKTPGARQ